MKLEQLNQEWNKAWLEKDDAFVERMMAPEYVYVAPNGFVLDRKAILDIIRAPTYKLSRSTRTEVRVIEIAPDAAVLLFRSRAAGSLRGRAFNDDHRCVSIFVKRGRRWLIAFEQCSPIA